MIKIILTPIAFVADFMHVFVGVLLSAILGDFSIADDVCANGVSHTSNLWKKKTKK